MSQRYPMMLHFRDGRQAIVKSEREEQAHIDKGWTLVAPESEPAPEAPLTTEERLIDMETVIDQSVQTMSALERRISELERAVTAPTEQVKGSARKG